MQNFLKPNKNFGTKTARQKRRRYFCKDFYGDRAGIMAEFGKIICISIGIYDKNNKFLIRSFAGDNEEKLLKEFGEIFNRPKLQNVILCTQRKNLIFLGLLEDFLLMECNRQFHSRCLEKTGNSTFGYDGIVENLVIGKSFISLELMAHFFGVPTPKDDIDGSWFRLSII